MYIYIYICIYIYIYIYIYPPIYTPLPTIQGGLKSVRVEGVRCPGAPSAALPLMLWWAALEGDSRILWLWHHGGNGDGVVGAGGAE